MQTSQLEELHESQRGGHSDSDEIEEAVPACEASMQELSMLMYPALHEHPPREFLEEFGLQVVQMEGVEQVLQRDGQFVEDDEPAEDARMHDPFILI